MNELQLRPTQPDDLEFVFQTEQHPDNRDFIIVWTPEQHIECLTNSDKQHLILETSDGKRIGYTILAGLNNPNHCVELVRIVIADKGKGYGKTAIRILQPYIFETLNAHRLWLDVKDYNRRAMHIYESAGFKVEGVLRECLKNGDRYDSLVIMALLRKEYLQQLWGLTT